jgi:hypothetical protein
MTLESDAPAGAVKVADSPELTLKRLKLCSRLPPLTRPTLWGMT